MSGYREYLRNLNGCDAHLGTFPFGGTNTIVDSLSLCIPVVTLEGSEPHSRADASLIRAAGLPEWLIAEDTDEYFAAAARLVRSDVERIECCRRLREMDFAAEFHDVEFERHENDLVNCLDWLWHNRDEIRADGRRRWTVADRLATGIPAGAEA
jgi:predicted O-linked N-acetylglucosamine transferase (SPINDLY family)